MDIIYVTSDIPSINTYPANQRLRYFSKKYNFLALVKDENKELEKEYNVKHVPVRGALSFLFMIPWALSHIIRSDKRTIVWTSFASVYTIIGLVSKLLGRRWIVDIWDDPYLILEMNRQGLYKIIQRLLLIINKQSYRFSDITLWTMHPERAKKYKLSKNTLFLTNGVELPLKVDSKKKKTDYINLIYVGYLWNDRGIDMIINSFKQVIKKLPNIRLYLVGPYQKEIYNQLKKTGLLGKGIIATGGVTQKKALQLINDSDICLITFPKKPELDYIYPIKIFEYMALKKPIISTDLLGVKEVIEESKCGIIIPPDDTIALERSILKLCEDKNMREQLGNNGSRAVKKYELNAMNKRIEKEIKKIVDKK